MCFAAYEPKNLQEMMFLFWSRIGRCKSFPQVAHQETNDVPSARDAACAPRDGDHWYQRGAWGPRIRASNSAVGHESAVRPYLTCMVLTAMRLC